MCMCVLVEWVYDNMIMSESEGDEIIVVYVVLHSF